MTILYYYEKTWTVTLEKRSVFLEWRGFPPMRWDFPPEVRTQEIGPLVRSLVWILSEKMPLLEDRRVIPGTEETIQPIHLLSLVIFALNEKHVELVFSVLKYNERKALTI